MDKDHFIKLTLALYRVTELFPEKDPLKFKLRERANEVLADLILILSFSNSFSKNPGFVLDNQIPDTLLKDVFSDIEVLENYFDLIENLNWVDSRNFFVLKREYNKIKEEIKNSTVSIKQKKEFKKRGLKDLKVSFRQKKILEIFKEKEENQVWEIQKKLPKISKRTIQRDLNKLLSRGLVKRKGENKSISYYLSPEISL